MKLSRLCGGADGDERVDPPLPVLHVQPQVVGPLGLQLAEVDANSGSTYVLVPQKYRKFSLANSLPLHFTKKVTTCVSLKIHVWMLEGVKYTWKYQVIWNLCRIFVDLLKSPVGWRLLFARTFP